MMRKYAWLTICVTVLGGSRVMAQPPVPPQGPVAPYMPYTVPLTSGQPRVPAQDAGEPYLVQPDVPSKESSRPPQPEPKPPTTVVESLGRLVEYAFSPDPNEPYTTYEGRPYQSAIRHDNSRMWTQGNYIHWWVRRDSVPPLATTGTTGVFGAPDTTVLLGDGGIAPKEFSGAQATIGMWLDAERLQSLELSGFFLGKVGRQYGFASDAGGTPLLAQPVLIPAEGRFAFASPGGATGSINVSNVMDMHGLELNVARNVYRINGWSMDTIIGARYAYLNDTLNSNINTTSLAPGFDFLGAPQPAGANFVINDSFNITNRFYGGQIGARFGFAWCRLDFAVTTKIAFGATHQVGIVDGTTTLNLAGVSNTAPGGLLAQTSNIGNQSSTVFSVLPEVTANWGFQITPRIRMLAGYTFLYWNRIQRAGDQIDRQIDLASQVPTSPTFTPGTSGPRPSYPSNRTEFWAQGINLGVELKY